MCVFDLCPSALLKQGWWVWSSLRLYIRGRPEAGSWKEEGGGKPHEFQRPELMTLHDTSENKTTQRSGVAPANQTKEGQFMNFSRGHSGTKVQCESCLFPKEKHQNVSFGLPGRLLRRAPDYARM